MSAFMKSETIRESRNSLTRRALENLVIAGAQSGLMQNLQKAESRDPAARSQRRSATMQILSDSMDRHSAPLWCGISMSAFTWVSRHPERYLPSAETKAIWCVRRSRSLTTYQITGGRDWNQCRKFASFRWRPGPVEAE